MRNKIDKGRGEIQLLVQHVGRCVGRKRKTITINDNKRKETKSISQCRCSLKKKKKKRFTNTGLGLEELRSVMFGNWKVKTGLVDY